MYDRLLCIQSGSDPLDGGAIEPTLFSIFPAALALGGAAAIWFYKIDSNTIKTFERELQERHA